MTQVPPSDKSSSKQSREAALYDALLSVKDSDEMRRFLADLCTPQEIATFAERWEIARLLFKGAGGYRQIAEKTGGSTTTVARVARFLHHEHHHGYVTVLNRLNSQDRKEMPRDESDNCPSEPKKPQSRRS